MIRSIVATFVAICTWSFALAGEPGPQGIAYPDIAASINATLCAHLYNPAELDTPAYRQIEAEIEALAARADIVTPAEEALSTALQQQGIGNH